MAEDKPTIEVKKSGLKVPLKKLMYDIESMKKALTKCDKNIKVFEDAIAKEQETKKEYRRIIAKLEEQLE